MDTTKKDQPKALKKKMAKSANILLAQRAAKKDWEDNPLRFEESIALARKHGTKVMKYLQEITVSDTETYDQIIAALRNKSNYLETPEQAKMLDKGIQNVVELVEFSGTFPLARIDKLSKFLDDMETLYPLTHLNQNIKEKILELCMVCLGICRESEQFVGIHLTNLFGLWEVDAPNGRLSGKFR